MRHNKKVAYKSVRNAPSHLGRKGISVKRFLSATFVLAVLTTALGVVGTASSSASAVIRCGQSQTQILGQKNLPSENPVARIRVRQQPGTREICGVIPQVYRELRASNIRVVQASTDKTIRFCTAPPDKQPVRVCRVKVPRHGSYEVWFTLHTKSGQPYRSYISVRV